MSDAPLCACGSGRAFSDCCGPILAGAPAPTAEACMRSRYVALTLGRFDHLDATEAPERLANGPIWNTPDAITPEGLGLTARTVDGGGADDMTGVVAFTARFRWKGEEQTLTERSTFRREGGQNGPWLYVDGHSAPVRRDAPKIGRNDPCSCGSGKKYKKCCGA